MVLAFFEECLLYSLMVHCGMTTMEEDNCPPGTLVRIANIRLLAWVGTATYMDGPEVTTVLHPNSPNVYMFLGSKTNIGSRHTNSTNALLLLGHDGRVLWLLHAGRDKPYGWFVPV